MNMLKNLMGIVVSLIMITVVTISAVVFFCIALVIWLFTAPFDKKRKALHMYSCGCLAFWAYIMPTWRIRVEGREKIDSRKTYVIVANHQSQLDIIMTALLFKHFKWVSKAEIMKIPFVGWQMALNRYILIKRGYFNSIGRMMGECETALSQGSSVLLFPEGTRSTDGKIGQFKPGAFVLAEKMKTGIIPVVIYGTLDALPKKSFISSGVHKIRVKVLDEIPHEKLSEKSSDENREEIRELMVKHLNIIRKRVELGL